MESDTSSWQAVLEVNGIIGHLVGKVVLEKNTMYLGKKPPFYDEDHETWERTAIIHTHIAGKS